jgi:hypothetical protein
VPLFKRRGHRAVDLGTFKPLPAPELAPIDRVVAEGVLIAESTVRMAIKNTLLVSALRDDRHFDPERLRTAAHQEFVTLAEQNDASALRFEREQKYAESDRLVQHYLDDRPVVETPEHQRRPEVFHAMAEALRAAADDPERIGRVVETARSDAWSELAREVTMRLAATSADISADPAYQRKRPKRIEALIKVDLAALVRQSERRREDLANRLEGY